MELSNQALTVSVVYSLVFIIYIILIVSQGEQFSLAYGVYFFLSLVVIVLTVYDTHCLSYGRCDTWSWIRTTIYCFLPVLVLVMLLYLVVTGQYKKKDETTVTYKVSNIPLVSQEIRQESR